MITDQVLQTNKMKDQNRSDNETLEESSCHPIAQCTHKKGNPSIEKCAGFPYLKSYSSYLHIFISVDL